jgi:hypothetical protein
MKKTAWLMNGLFASFLQIKVLIKLLVQAHASIVRLENQVLDVG